MPSFTFADSFISKSKLGVSVSHKPTMSMTPSSDKLSPLHFNTPLVESLVLSHVYGKPVWLKMDIMQPTGSFKIRGIGRLCQKLVAEGATQFVASSGGNAGIAVAFAGRKLGIPVTVFVPEPTKPVFLERLALEGASVHRVGQVWDDAHQAATAYCHENPSAAYVHPFDHPELWHGHATLVDEIVAAGVEPSAIAVAVGGGGLLCGVAEGLAHHGLPQTKILAVETEGAASMHAALKADKPVYIDHVETIATSLAPKRVTAKVLDWVHTWPQNTLMPALVSDAETIQACRWLLDHHNVLVEPACGAALAPFLVPSPLRMAALSQIKQLPGSVVIVVCGGVGLTTADLMAYEAQYRLQNPFHLTAKTPSEVGSLPKVVEKPF
jgi:L-serine/L-threonine ammonia-lyase